jgi:hypothetical protein
MTIVHVAEDNDVAMNEERSSTGEVWSHPGSKLQNLFILSVELARFVGDMAP